MRVRWSEAGCLLVVCGLALRLLVPTVFHAARRWTVSERVLRSGRWALVFAVLAAFVGAAPPVVLAGDSDTAPPPARVRVTLASSGKRITGRLVEQDETALFIEKGRRNPKRITIPRSDVAQFERSVQRGRKGRGLGIGLLVGAGVAAAAGYAGGNDCIEDATGFDNLANMGCSETDKAVMYGLLTVPLGMLIGAVAAPGEKWSSESLPPVAVGLGPAPGGGVYARVVLRF